MGGGLVVVLGVWRLVDGRGCGAVGAASRACLRLLVELHHGGQLWVVTGLTMEAQRLRAVRR